MKKLISWLAALVLATGLGLFVPAGANAAAPYCGIRWGSGPKLAVEGPGGDTHVTNVRAGRHACFDRLVVDMDAPSDGYVVRYVDEYTGVAGAHPIVLRGGADLSVVAFAAAYEEDGHGGIRGTYAFDDPQELVDVTGFRTFRQVAWGGSFEARTSLGLGVRARLPFRAFLLDGPGEGSRLVVDVAHRW